MIILVVSFTFQPPYRNRNHFKNYTSCHIALFAASYSQKLKMFFCVCIVNRAMMTASSSSTLFAEDRDFEAEITKMEKEAEERLEAKTKEMMATIASTGAAK